MNEIYVETLRDPDGHPKQCLPPPKVGGGIKLLLVTVRVDNPVGKLFNRFYLYQNHTIHEGVAIPKHFFFTFLVMRGPLPLISEPKVFRNDKHGPTSLGDLRKFLPGTLK